jgi:hypothetical protein
MIRRVFVQPMALLFLFLRHCTVLMCLSCDDDYAKAFATLTCNDTKLLTCLVKKDEKDCVREKVPSEDDETRWVQAMYKSDDVRLRSSHGRN